MSDILHKFYADENFPNRVVAELRLNELDVITAFEDGKANKQIPDDEVITRAVELNRVVLTQDKDFKKIHIELPDHCGIILCTFDRDYKGQAQRIIEACANNETLNGVLLKIYRPSK